MLVMVNATPVKLGGGVQVALSLIEELRNHPEHDHVVLMSPQVASAVEGGGLGPDVASHVVPGNVTSMGADGHRARAWLRQMEAEERPDAVLTVFGPAMWRPRAPHLMGFANGLYLSLDSRFIRDHFLADPVSRARYLARRTILLGELRREARHFWIETEAARADLCRILHLAPSQVTVASNSFGAPFRDLGDRLAEPRRPGPMQLLCLANWYPHKNLEMVREVLPLLRHRAVEVEFSMTLRESEFTALFGPEGSTPGVRNLGPLRPDECPDAYLGADALFFPSLLETFSATYPEAMVTGRPVLTSDLPFARSVCGDAAGYFDPYDARSACDAIERLVRDPAWRSDLVAKGRARLKTFDDAATRCTKLLRVLEGLVDDATHGLAEPPSVARTVHHGQG